MSVVVTNELAQTGMPLDLAYLEIASIAIAGEFVLVTGNTSLSGVRHDYFSVIICFVTFFLTPQDSKKFIHYRVDSKIKFSKLFEVNSKQQPSLLLSIYQSDQILLHYE